MWNGDLFIWTSIKFELAIAICLFWKVTYCYPRDGHQRRNPELQRHEKEPKVNKPKNWNGRKLDHWKGIEINSDSSAVCPVKNTGYSLALYFLQIIVLIFKLEVFFSMITLFTLQRSKKKWGKILVNRQPYQPSGRGRVQDIDLGFPRNEIPWTLISSIKNRSFFEEFWFIRKKEFWWVKFEISSEA